MALGLVVVTYQDAVMTHLPANGPVGQERLTYSVRRGDLLMVFVNTVFTALGEAQQAGFGNTKSTDNGGTGSDEVTVTVSVSQVPVKRYPTALRLRPPTYAVSVPEVAFLPAPKLQQISRHLLWGGPWTCSNFYVLLSGTGEVLPSPAEASLLARTAAERMRNGNGTG